MSRVIYAELFFEFRDQVRQEEITYSGITIQPS